MEKKVRNIIKALFRKYGVDKGVENNMRMERIVNLCMNDIACHPGLEAELCDPRSLTYFVKQTILFSLPISKIEKL